jgi:hypothetical protein
MFEDTDEDFEEESPPPEQSDNRTFLIAAGVLGGITLLALICMAAYVLLIAPGQRTARNEELTAIAAQNTEAALVDRAQTQTASAPTATSIPTSTGTATSSPTPVVARATATPRVTLEDTDDLTAELVAAIASFSPQLLDDLTEEMLLSLRTEILEALPDDFLDGLEPALRARIEARLNPPDPDPDPVALPPSWIAAAGNGGDTIATTDDLTEQIVADNGLFEGTLLDQLTPEMLLAMPVEVVVELPDDFVAGLDPDLRAQLEARLISPDPDPEPVALPPSWIEAAASGGNTIETTDDLDVTIVVDNGLFDPPLLDEVTPGMLLALPLDVLEEVPDSFIAGLDTDLRRLIDARLNPPDPEPEPVGLPESWADAAVQLTAAPTVGPRTATVAALLTQAAQQTATVLPTATALPGTGFADEVGAPSLLALAALLILVIFLVRRLRKVDA